MSTDPHPAPGPHEEPELNNERDLPTEGGTAETSPRDPAGAPARQRGTEADAEGRLAAAPPREDVAGRESVAGEEDPGAALDTTPDDPDAGR